MTMGKFVEVALGNAEQLASLVAVENFLLEINVVVTVFFWIDRFHGW